MRQLSRDDLQLFDSVWDPLLWYANKRFHVVPKASLSQHTLYSASLSYISTVSSMIWENRSILDDFIADSPDMSEENKAIVKSWKQAVVGPFFVVRNLPNGSIFISEEDRVYRVVGLMSAIEELFPTRALPARVETALLPFKDVIVTSGLFRKENVRFDSDVKNTVQDIYMDAKEKGQIITHL